ncbi:MAG: helix-turn-helix domain-containing protein [Pseudomonadota bacterium]
MAAHPLETIWRDAGSLSAGSDLSGIVRHFHGESASKASRAAARRVAAPRQEPGSDFVEALAHGIAVLECWQGTDVWLSNSELAARSGLTRPTVSRLASVLEDLGYLAREGNRGRLRLTGATLGLGFGSALSTGSTIPAKAELEELACELDVYAALSIRRIDKVQIIENVASPLHPDAVLNDVGAMLPMCRSASGLAAMSALPEQDMSPLLVRMQAHYGDRWASLERRLAAKRQEYSSKGYCTSVAMLSQNVGAVAVPIMPAGSNDIFVLACGMPARDFYPERVERSIAPKMLKAARALRESMSR